VILIASCFVAQTSRSQCDRVHHRQLTDERQMDELLRHLKLSKFNHQNSSILSYVCDTTGHDTNKQTNKRRYKHDMSEPIMWTTRQFTLAQYVSGSFLLHLRQRLCEREQSREVWCSHTGNGIPSLRRIETIRSTVWIVSIDDVLEYFGMFVYYGIEESE